MCGRLVAISTLKQLARAVRAEPGAREVKPRYNIAPTQPVPAALAGDTRRLDWIRWGLPRPAPLSRGGLVINARAETLSAKPLFAPLLARHRCVVLADAFYEWGLRAGGRSKQPWLFRRRDREPLVLAALWRPGAETTSSAAPCCVLVTTAANTLMQPVHDRMPALLTAEQADRWLAPGPLEAGALAACLRPFDDAALAAHPVGPWVNRVSCDDPRCMEPVVLPPEHPELFAK